MTSIAIAGGDYDTATESFVGANQTAAVFYARLVSRLDRCAAMAGDDSTSTDFGTAYDAAAREAVHLYADLVGAFTTLASLTARSVDNHRAADRTSRIDSPAPLLDPSMRHSPVGVTASSPPSCVGGDDEDLPDFWNHVVDHLQGFAWPNADTDRLRSAADVWHGAAADLRELPRYGDTAAAMLQTQRSPEIPVALDAIDELQRSVEDLAVMCGDLGRSCDDYATEVDAHRDTIRGILRDLAIEAGFSMAFGAATSFFTVGLGAAAGTAIAGTRVVAAARRIIAALRALEAAAKLRAVTRLTEAVERIGPLRSVLARFKTARHLDDAADVTEVRKIDDLADLDHVHNPHDPDSPAEPDEPVDADKAADDPADPDSPADPDASAGSEGSDPVPGQEPWRDLPVKIDHTWDTEFPYKKGDAYPMEHVQRGHWPDSTVPAKSHFGDDITEQKLIDYVDEAVRRGEIDPDDPGTINCDLGRVIGTATDGTPTSHIRVHIRKGIVNSAYPVG